MLAKDGVYKYLIGSSYITAPRKYILIEIRSNKLDTAGIELSPFHST